ncbi:hypothetical protein [Congregibacter litoralis]|uniref:hypothetical protein n=1 Tax=Congregibacter litoralis TaxID=393662 RepID=UPI0012603524|nr:hypothetical protein [Congregibacter litoralis]
MSVLVGFSMDAMSDCSADWAQAQLLIGKNIEQSKTVSDAERDAFGFYDYNFDAAIDEFDFTVNQNIRYLEAELEQQRRLIGELLTLTKNLQRCDGKGDFNERIDRLEYLMTEDAESNETQLKDVRCLLSVAGPIERMIEALFDAADGSDAQYLDGLKKKYERASSRARTVDLESYCPETTGFTVSDTLDRLDDLYFEYF